MSVSTAQASVTALKAALVGYIATITHTDATTQTILRATATLALDNWANAKNAAANLAASAAANYSNGVGMAISKRQTDQAEADADRYMSEFVAACSRGGVDVASMSNPGVGLWDLSGASV